MRRFKYSWRFIAVGSVAILSGCLGSNPREPRLLYHVATPPVLSSDEALDVYNRTIKDRLRLERPDDPDWSKAYVCAGVRSRGGNWVVVDVLVGWKFPPKPDKIYKQRFWFENEILQGMSSRGELVLIEMDSKKIRSRGFDVKWPTQTDRDQILDQGRYAESPFLVTMEEGLRYEWAALAVPVKLERAVRIGDVLELKLSPGLCDGGYSGCDLEQRCVVQPLTDGAPEPNPT